MGVCGDAETPVGIGAARNALICRTRQQAYLALCEHYALKLREPGDYARFDEYTLKAARAGRLAKRYERLAGLGPCEWRGVA